MQILFRADASSAIGYGHVMRCLALASALRDDGARCIFASQPHDGDLRGQIETRGFPVISVTDLSADGMAGMLRDANLRPDWLIVDHYQLGRDWESAMRPHVGKILAIDDPPRRAHDCDVLLDQTTVVGPGDAPVPNEPGPTALIGVDYAVLQPEYRQLRPQTPPRTGPIRRILIAFGGADRFGMTLHALQAALAGTADTVAIDVAMPGSIPDRGAIEALASSASRVTLHVDAPTLAPLIAAADLGIGAAGSTSWERLCLGLPSILVTLAPNQEAIARALDELLLAKWVGGIDAAVSGLRDAITSLVTTGIDDSWSRHCAAFVDGKGAPRVAAVLTASASSALRARRADREDELRLLRWANDPVTRRDSFSQRRITTDEHREWFNRLLRDDGARQYIIETRSGAEIGQVRFQQRDDDWEVHYAVAPEFRGRKLGSKLLRVALDDVRTTYRGRIVGCVKADNLASQKIFAALGFRVDRADRDTLTYAHAL